MKAAQSCDICGEAFSLISRRRVCKRCKRSCCNNCIDDTYVHPTGNSARVGDAEPTETCTDCILAEATNYSISVQEELDVTEEINRGLKNELKRQLHAMEKFRGFLVEFCEAFSPESALFTENTSGKGEQGTATKVDSTQPIANLIDLGAESLQNLYARIKLMRSELEATRTGNEHLRKTLDQAREQLDAVARERDCMKTSLNRVNEAVLRLEAEKQHIADLRRDYDALRVRCAKMEEQQSQLSARSNATSLPRYDESYEWRPRYSALFSLCCPRITF
ncbi:uncharacterized protein BXIN_0657 [Babesia sp. Xinjiang]|uniref:uncharacterized protein n=1 Tax=Babesia sp. Xinjiang TaxID=462227 RepID=UPI000A25A9AF|nr:uncharacterized protein BXIN_0657 [Babesia sp. Xinjiang]ORM41776.1 hypothetical protein BXIN_0657 [Babesia sp. Xinjiang]